ncbi:MAG: hypothetical protein GX996_10840, partial [Firmicutes bacterium]|nr:hypothetical protein [Bacillota bacterium]
ISGKLGLVGTISTWKDVQAIVRRGQANRYFRIGDQLMSLYDGEPIVWVVVGIDHDEPSDPNYINSMTIQTQDCIDNVQFDAPEPNNLDEDRKNKGNNRYIHSAKRQWLNSSADTFQWQSQHQYDAPPTSSSNIYNGPGFLKLIDPELVAVLGKVKKQVARNTVTDDGGQDIFEDKVFPLSRVEVGLDSEGDTTGEKVYPYYQGASNADRIKLLNGSARTWWLRSPCVSYSDYVRGVVTDGSLNRYYAYRALGAAPACVII